MEKNPKKRRKRQTWGLGAIIIIRRDLTDDAINLSIALVFANCQSGSIFFFVGDLISLMSCDVGVLNANVFYHSFHFLFII
jgi:hypothetical protein